MILSRPFLAGLAILVGIELIAPRLPGPLDLPRLLGCALLLPVPAWLARRNGRAVVERSLAGRPLGAALQVTTVLERIAIPLIYGLAIAWGGLLDLADALAPASEAGRTAVLIGPLLAMELAVRAVELDIADWLRARGFVPPSTLVVARARTSLLLACGLVTVGLALDLLGRWRALEVWLTATDLGVTLGLLLAVPLIATALPPALLIALPTDRRLPAEWLEPIRAFCRELAFPPRAVRLLHTERRMVTAALLGTFWPFRYLLLTDGILATLGPFELRGVIAHEVAHARRHHIALKLAVFVLLPAFLVHPLTRLDVGSLAPDEALAALVAVAVVAWLGCRAFLFRLEYEADLASAELLGDAAPTSSALRRVSEMLPASTSWLPGFHPADRDRLAALRAWSTDPEFRRRFARRGRAVRATVVALLTAAIAWNVSAHAQSWAGDRCRVALLTGDFRHAAALCDAASDDDPDWRDLRAVVHAAVELAGAGGDWASLRDDLADRAWQRALRELDAAGPAAALPYLQLATVVPAPGPVRRTVLRMCSALDDDDPPEAMRCATHLRTLPDVPAEVARAIERIEPHDAATQAIGGRN
ncbi:MAG: M48 family metalloprotease [Planctomycetes bacterium]|nr:M48 family metalloprotease [Planctomycetota bacterium]